MGEGFNPVSVAVRPSPPLLGVASAQVEGMSRAGNKKPDLPSKQGLALELFGHFLYHIAFNDELHC